MYTSFAKVCNGPSGESAFSGYPSSQVAKAQLQPVGTMLTKSQSEIPKVKEPKRRRSRSIWDIPEAGVEDEKKVTISRRR